MSRSPQYLPLRVRLDREDHLIVGFATFLVACQHTDNFPGYAPGGPPDGLRSPMPYAPGVERLSSAFYSSPFYPLFTRRPRIAYGSSNVHDANDPASACGIDGLHEFLIFPQATPTRTSLASFESFLPLLTCLLLSFFILRFYGPTVAPRVSSG